ncbi:MAG: XamI family restriction endonuclease [Candidatus Nanopelagicales bacterium]
MAPTWVEAPRWTEDELTSSCEAEAVSFRAVRNQEGPVAFREAFEVALPEVQSALARTRNLQDLPGGAVFVSEPDRLEAFRYFCGPPISEEDLWTMVGAKFRNVPASHAAEVAEALVAALDPVRFPWIALDRDPTPQEHDRAEFATAVLMAARKVSTDRRGTASKRQEAEVAARLLAAGYELDPARTEMHMLDQLERGRFSRERKIHGKKCDVPVRLKDGRLLAIECKVSNGPKNGWKRLNTEVGGKAGIWGSRLGSAQVVTVAVLTGIFDLSALLKAQADGVVLFWERDLKPLDDFLAHVDASI